MISETNGYYKGRRSKQNPFLKHRTKLKKKFFKVK